MNTGMSFLAIVSLLLAMAMAGESVKQQAGGTAPSAQSYSCGSVDKIAINHNETMVSDMAFVEEASLWLRSFLVTQFETYARAGKGGCDDEFGCGTNHNETMVSDVALAEQSSPWLNSLRSFILTQVVIYIRGGGGCDEWGCGTNHNETLITDMTR